MDDQQPELTTAYSADIFLREFARTALDDRVRTMGEAHRIDINMGATIRVLRARSLYGDQSTDLHIDVDSFDRCVHKINEIGQWYF